MGHSLETAGAPAAMGSPPLILQHPTAVRVEKSPPLLRALGMLLRQMNKSLWGFFMDNFKDNQNKVWGRGGNIKKVHAKELNIR
jgi:hypothetical protein